MKRLPESLIRQGLAVGALLDAAVAAQTAFLQSLEEYDDGIDDPPAPPPAADPTYPPFDGCAHPIEMRQDTTTSGQPKSFFCAGCRRTSDELKRAS